jgi:5'-methylthioadenosine phosphorylase
MKIGIIGGSGLDDPKLLENYEEVEVGTPYGTPSSKITCGKIGNTEVCILARHGKKHQIPPTQVNNRANIFALGKLGCKHIIATTAVGSLREEIGRGDFVILSDFIDFTRHRKITFFEEFKENPEHTPMADPFSVLLRKKIIASCKSLGIPFHEKGTVITIEGPRFSTRAESNMFRMWGADVINMSIAPEAILAKEAALEYSAIAMSTDYDCWKLDEEPVSWNQILKTFNENSEKMKKLLVDVASSE